MRSFSEENYRNIQSLFTEKTGVPLRKRRAARAAPFALAAAVLAALLTVTALAADLFSPLAGDDLALGAVYEGDGVVSVHVENRSDKELKFQEQLRLLRWDTSEEIAPKRGAAVRFANTAFAPHTEGVMTLDLSRAYDLAALDEPLAPGRILSRFDEQQFCVRSGLDLLHPCRRAGRDRGNGGSRTGENAGAHRRTPRPRGDGRGAYRPCGGNAAAIFCNDRRRGAAPRPQRGVLRRVLRASRAAGDARGAPRPVGSCHRRCGGGRHLRSRRAADAQHLLTGENYTTLDAYGLPVGGAPGEEALVLSALVAQRAGDTDGGAPIPVVYLFTYFREDVENADHLFVHGRLVPLSEVEDRRVYEDERYVCYELSEYFYTDVQTHAETLCEQRGDVCWDEAARLRVQKIYDYYTNAETLARLVRHLAA